VAGQRTPGERHGVGLGSRTAKHPRAALLQSVDANEVFVAMPEIIVAALERQGFGFYRLAAERRPGRCRHPLGHFVRDAAGACG